jgi:hypothetical protein
MMDPENSFLVFILGSLIVACMAAMIALVM